MIKKRDFLVLFIISRFLFKINDFKCQFCDIKFDKIIY